MRQGRFYCFRLGMASQASAWISGAWDLAAAIGARVPDAVVTFEPGQEALGAWQEIQGEAMSVNGALYTGTIEGTVRLDGS